VTIGLYGGGALSAWGRGMKRATWLSIAIGLCLATAAAAAESGSIVVALAASTGPRVANLLRQHADFVAAEVGVKVDESDAARRFTAIAAGKAKLADEVRKHPGWIFLDGPVALSAPEQSKFTSSYGPTNRASATVLAALGAETDVYAQSAALAAAFAQLEKQSSFELPVQRIELAVRDAQQYRPQLLKIVAEEAVRTRDALVAGGQIELSGLEGPVWVRQVDDRDVELYLDYKLAVGSAGRK